jgi:hypothetical protein
MRPRFPKIIVLVDQPCFPVDDALSQSRLNEHGSMNVDTKVTDSDTTVCGWIGFAVADATRLCSRASRRRQPRRRDENQATNRHEADDPKQVEPWTENVSENVSEDARKCERQPHVQCSHAEDCARGSAPHQRRERKEPEQDCRERRPGPSCRHARTESRDESESVQSGEDRKENDYEREPSLHGPAGTAQMLCSSTARRRTRPRFSWAATRTGRRVRMPFKRPMLLSQEVLRRRSLTELSRAHSAPRERALRPTTPADSPSRRCAPPVHALTRAFIHAIDVSLRHECHE